MLLNKSKWSQLNLTFCTSSAEVGKDKMNGGNFWITFWQQVCNVLKGCVDNIWFDFHTEPNIRDKQQQQEDDKKDKKLKEKVFRFSIFWA